MRLSVRPLAAMAALAAIGVGLLIGAGGWPGAGGSIFIGHPDCETFSSGLIRQPVGAWTSLAFLPVGIWAIGDRRLLPPTIRLLLGGGFIAVALGSFLGHAAQTDWARRLDSLAIKLMLTAFLIAAVGRLRAWNGAQLLAGWLAFTAAVFGLEITWRATGDPLLGVMSVLAVALTALIADPDGRLWLGAGLGILALGAATWWLGRAGGPLCAPWAVFQLHGVWHILAAAGVGLAYQAHRGDAV